MLCNVHCDPFRLHCIMWSLIITSASLSAITQSRPWWCWCWLLSEPRAGLCSSRPHMSGQLYTHRMCGAQGWAEPVALNNQLLPGQIWDLVTVQNVSDSHLDFDNYFSWVWNISLKTPVMSLHWTDKAPMLAHCALPGLGWFSLSLSLGWRGTESWSWCRVTRPFMTVMTPA